jgi:Phosphatidylinositol 3- and 4-kinase
MNYNKNHTEAEIFRVAVIPRDVQPLFAKDKGTAEAIQQAYAKRLVFDISLGGKYSNGAAIALDPENERAWLLKPEVSKQSPAAGVNDLPVSKSKREAAFSEIASLVGDGDQFAKATVVFLDGHETAAIELADTDYKNIPFLQKKPTGEQGVIDIFKDYQDSGQMWQWSFLDYVLGNTDRHSNNILIDPETEDVKLIDHGGAFAGDGFNPGGDSKTFIPYYLRSDAPKGFNTLPPEAKLRYLAKPSAVQETQFLNWLNSIDETRVFQILREYGIDIEPFKRRFDTLKNAKNSIGLMLKLWVKPNETLVKAEDSKPWFLMDEQELAEHEAEQQRQKQRQHEIDLNEHNPLSDDVQRQQDLYLSEVKNNKNPYSVAPPDGMIKAMSAGQLKKFLKEAPIEAIWNQGGIHSSISKVLNSDNPLKRRVFADISLSRFSEAAEKFPSFEKISNYLERDIGHEMRHASEDGLINFFENSFASDKAQSHLNTDTVIDFLQGDGESLKDPDISTKPRLGEKFKQWAMSSPGRASFLPAHLASTVTPEEFHRTLDGAVASGSGIPTQALLDANVGPQDRAKLYNALWKQSPMWDTNLYHGLHSLVQDPTKQKQVGHELANHPAVGANTLGKLGRDDSLGIHLNSDQVERAKSDLVGIDAPASLIANQLSIDPDRQDLNHHLDSPKLASKVAYMFFGHDHYKKSPKHQELFEKLRTHPSVIKGKVHKFWNDYEEKVKADHFATVQKFLNGNDEEVALRGFRGDHGDSARHPDVHKGLAAHAKDVQGHLLADKNAAIKHINGKPHILVYRGVSGEYGHKIKQALDQGADDVQIPNAQFSSWTTRQGVARNFSDRSISGQNHASVIMRRWMPVEDLLHSGVHKVSDDQHHVHPHESELIFQHRTPLITVPKEDIQHTVDYHSEPVVNLFETHDHYLVNKHGFPVPTHSYSGIGNLTNRIKFEPPNFTQSILPFAIKPMGELYDQDELEDVVSKLSTKKAKTPEQHVKDKAENDKLYSEFKGTKLDPNNAGDDSEVWEKS